MSKKIKASEYLEVDDDFVDLVAQRVAEKSKPEKTLFTPAEVAAMTPVKVETIRAHIRQGALKASWRGRGWIITKEDLDKYLAGNG